MCSNPSGACLGGPPSRGGYYWLALTSAGRARSLFYTPNAAHRGSKAAGALRTDPLVLVMPGKNRHLPDLIKMTGFQW